MMKVAFLGLAMAATVAFFLSRSAGGISGAKARELVTNGARLVDVRTASEFADGHIEGAVNIPVQDLERRVEELEDRSDAVVVYCRSGRRSAQAKKILESAGFAQVYDLGGIGRWDQS